MANDPRGRWFRVYARQVRQHPKFRSLTLAELGAWTDLRAAAELLDGDPFVNREDAVLILRRRERSRAKCSQLIDRLIEVRLLDELAEGSIGIHDLADHDRQRYPSDAPEQARERQRRSRQSRAGHESVTSRDTDSHDTRARESRAEQPRTEAEPASDPMLQASELPSEDDSATLACRQLFDSGKWLGDREYVAAWEDMDRRYSPEWVQAEIAPAFAACLEKRGKVLPWDLKRMTEGRLAERSRAEERGREEAIAHREDAARAARESAAATMSAEEQERQSLIRRAIGVWIKGGRKGKVPEKVDDLREWLDHNEGAPA